MPKYALHYFNGVRAVAEGIELLLTYTKTPYDRVRLADDAWGADKWKYPRGRLPVLFVDGKPLCEVAVILKYLGDTLGLTPKDPWDAIKELELLNGYSDSYMEMFSWIYSPDGKDCGKMDFVRQRREIYVRPFFRQCEEMLGNPSGWIYDKICAGDFAMHNLAKALSYYWGVPQEEFPKLAAHSEAIEALPELKDYFDMVKDVPWSGGMCPNEDPEGEMCVMIKQYAKLTKGREG